MGASARLHFQARRTQRWDQYSPNLDSHRNPPKLISAEPPMQTLVKPQNVPKTTLEAIENMIKEDLESNLSPDATLDEQKEEVGFAFEDAKTMMTSPRLAALHNCQKTFAYYPNIEDFFEPGQFYSD